MRQGEMLALTWADVDFRDGNVCRVTKSVRTGDKAAPAGQGREDEGEPPPHPPHPPHARRAWRARFGGRLVFSARWPLPATEGKQRYVNKANLRKTFRQACWGRPALPAIRFHDLRHTHATLALQETKNVKAVSARLGHADVRVTLNTYAHYLPVMEEEYVSAMETPSGARPFLRRPRRNRLSRRPFRPNHP